MTQRLGLKPQEDEYILMGMAAYGDPTRRVNGKTLFDHIMQDFDIRINYQGKIVYFGENLHRGCNWWMPELTSEQDHFDIAAAVQEVYEFISYYVISYAKHIINSDNLVLMGGCALNCSANSNITKAFDNIWIMPNPGDAGSCIGATQKYFDTRNYRVLGVTTGERRMMNLKRATEQARGDHFFWFTTQDVVDIWQPETILDRVWLVASKEEQQALFQN